MAGALSGGARPESIRAGIALSCLSHLMPASAGRFRRVAERRAGPARCRFLSPCFTALVTRCAAYQWARFTQQQVGVLTWSRNRISCTMRAPTRVTYGLRPVVPQLALRARAFISSCDAVDRCVAPLRAR